MIISKDFKFEAGHHLRDYVGKCANPHGHSYFGRIWIATPASNLDKTGFVMDYGEISDVVNSLDHKDLNEIEYFKQINPTAENIAICLVRLLEVRLPTTHTVAIKLQETASSSVFYTNDSNLEFLAAV